jgi:hypothetical protein
MVVFGGSVYNVTQQAKPSAIAAQNYAYEFRVPEYCGPVNSHSALKRVQDLGSNERFIMQDDPGRAGRRLLHGTLCFQHPVHFLSLLLPPNSAECLWPQIDFTSKLG